MQTPAHFTSEIWAACASTSAVPEAEPPIPPKATGGDQLEKLNVPALSTNTLNTTSGVHAKQTKCVHYVPHHLKPDIPAHKFRSTYCRRSQVADYLHRVLKPIAPIKVDFDLAVAYFLQQTNHLKLGNIPASVNKIFDDFSILAPLTGRQDNLAYCARYIKRTIDVYSSDPKGIRPFALRYPNLRALNQLAIDRSVMPKIIGKDEAVILLDLADRPLAIGIPPKNSTAATLSGQVYGFFHCSSVQAILDC